MLPPDKTSWLIAAVLGMLFILISLYTQFFTFGPAAFPLQFQPPLTNVSSDLTAYQGHMRVLFGDMSALRSDVASLRVAVAEARSGAVQATEVGKQAGECHSNVEELHEELLALASLVNGMEGRLRRQIQQ